MNSLNKSSSNLELTYILADMRPQDQPSFIKLTATVRGEHQISEEEYTLSQIYRFFRGNRADYQKSLDAVLANIAWRRTAPFKEAIELDLGQFDYVYQFVKMGFYGLDSQGRPIRVIRPPSLDPQILAERYDEQTRFLYGLQNIERIQNIIFPLCSRKAGRYIEGMISIVDIKEVNTAKIIGNIKLLNSVKANSKVFQEHYPEMAHRAIIINAGFMFTGLWNIVKLFLNRLTLEKFVIFGSNYMGELLKHTTRENLPVAIGGTCTEDINSFPNFFDQEMSASVAEKRLKLKFSPFLA